VCKPIIDTDLTNCLPEWILLSVAAAIRFATTEDGGLQLCVDYLPLNLSMVKNRYPYPEMSARLSQLWDVCIFTERDLWHGYHVIGINIPDKLKTTFCTRTAQFEYYVIPFSMTNAVAKIRSYIYDGLWLYIVDIAVWYIN
jgi:hypothetical protein